MSEKDSNKILRFPSSQQAPKEENKLLAIFKAAQEKISELKPIGTDDGSQVTPGLTVINNISIHGGNNQLAPGHLTVSTSETPGITQNSQAEKSEAPSDAINSAQKLQLRKLRDEIVKLSAECGFPKHPASIMSSLNSTMGVRKYDQIVIDEFHIARTHLTTMKGVFAERLDFHRKREELRRHMIQVVAESHRKNQPTGTVAMLGAALDALAFSDLEKMYDQVITDVI